ncbi:MAG: MBL fold metallo-hydrolase [Candidatus Bathyarchaeota archaeon]|jgi:glyoxylase-like metal-dependent hydrolase (beta-lactamase superfamily II)
MYTTQLDDFTHQIDLKTAGYENFIASYVLKEDKVAIIETGPTSSIPNLLAGLREIGIQNEAVDYVLVSHIHLDHAGGAGTLLQNLPNAKLLVQKRGAPHMADPEKLWVRSRAVLREVVDSYGQIQPVPENRMIIPEDGAIIDLGEHVKLQVIETLGHASHHQSFYEKRGRILFLGDAGGIYIKKLDSSIPTTPPPLHLEMKLNSIEKLKKLEPKLLCYTHFGHTNNAVDRMQAYVEQLKLWAKIVSESTGRGDDQEAIYARIMEHDPSMKKAEEFIKRHIMLRQSVVLQSIQGFIQYFERNS